MEVKITGEFLVMLLKNAFFSFVYFSVVVIYLLNSEIYK